MNLPQINELNLSSKKVLLRANYDVPLRKKENKIAETARIDESLPTIEYLLKNNAEVIIVSHLGRPKGEVIPSLSLKPVAEYLGELLEQEVPLVTEIDKLSEQNESVVLLENIRFFKGEEDNDKEFALSLSRQADFFVNEAFASHQAHASVVGLPQLLPSAFGFGFIKEIETLSALRKEAKRPLVVILGGLKKGKLSRVKDLANWADYVLIGGKLASFTDDDFPTNVIKAKLNPENKDITLESLKEFEKIIKQSKTVVWAGPMGMFEEEQFSRGTKMLADIIVKTNAFTVVGGGDTQAALSKFGQDKKIDFISSGGGAMLRFLAENSLPAIEALKKEND